MTNRRKITLIVIAVLVVESCCSAGNCKKYLAACCKNQKTEPNLSVCKTPKTNTIDPILKKLNENAKKLKSYEANIKYLVIQTMLESKILREGKLYYQQSANQSNLRINLNTVKYDDDKEQQDIQQYIFDGIWLTHIDYPNKQAKKYQQAEPNNPIDCFELVRQNFPIIGFSKTEDLEEDFQIKLVEQKKDSEFIKLHLKVKPDSTYKANYSSVDFWIDKKLFLPAKIIAHSIGDDPSEEEIYEITFIKPKVNKKIDEKVFEFRIPKEIGQPEIVPLKKNKD